MASSHLPSKFQEWLESDSTVPTKSFVAAASEPSARTRIPISKPAAAELVGSADADSDSDDDSRGYIKIGAIDDPKAHYMSCEGNQIFVKARDDIIMNPSSQTEIVTDVCFVATVPAMVHMMTKCRMIRLVSCRKAENGTFRILLENISEGKVTIPKDSSFIKIDILRRCRCGSFNILRVDKADSHTHH